MPVYIQHGDQAIWLRIVVTVNTRQILTASRGEPENACRCYIVDFRKLQ